MSQLHFFKKTNEKGHRAPGRPRTRPESCFGGDHFRNYNPREQRPISSNKALHLVLRSSQATGAHSMKKSALADKIWDIIEKHALKNNVRVYEYANAGNHLHLLIRVKRRDDYQRFIRSITGLIARAVKGCQRGTPLMKKFWDARPFTRIVSFSGEQFRKVKMYLARNRMEALGFAVYQPRTMRRKTPEWQAFWSHYTCVP